MHWTQRTRNVLKWSQSSALAILLGFYTSIFGVQAVDVRLSGGRTLSEGIVQIRSSEETQWRLVCGKVEGWNIKIAICKHQGYVTADKNYPWTVTGNVSSELQSSLAVCDIQCNADAELIEHCNISWKENGTDCKCERGRPMGVTCIMSKRGSVEVRLTGGRTPFEGRVEVRRDGENSWRYICGAGTAWNLTVARAVCKQLGYVTVMWEWSNSEFGRSDLQSSVCDVRCPIMSESLEDCTVDWDNDGHDCQCDDNYHVGITCYSIFATPTLSVISTISAREVSKRKATSPSPKDTTMQPVISQHCPTKPYKSCNCSKQLAIGFVIGVIVSLAVTAITTIVIKIVYKRRQAMKRDKKVEETASYVNSKVEDSSYTSLQLNEVTQSTYESLNSTQEGSTISKDAGNTIEDAIE